MDTEIKTTRTSGDGMEHEDIIDVENNNAKIHPEIKETTNKPTKQPTDTKNTRPIPGENSIYRPDQHKPVPLPAVVPKGKLYLLVPKLVKPQKSHHDHQNKEPRFIPFEPYKAAINPIIPIRRKKMKRNRNNLDINILVSQMSNMKTSALKLNETSGVASKSELDEIKENYEKQFEEMKKEQDHLNAKLKFQMQVNSELKNLLVAAVGEDLQTRVNVLTEDKLQLARALLDTANNLSTHTEQIEYLAGQCEVWRSKFLASSVMVEELARWKADLSQKNSLLSESNKQMLQLTSQIRSMEVELLKNLRFIAKIKSLNIPSSNAVDLIAECLNISQQIVLHSGIGMPDNLNLNHLSNITEAEKLAMEALENVSQPLMSTDEAFKAIVGQAFPSKDLSKLANDLNDNNISRRSSRADKN